MEKVSYMYDTTYALLHKYYKVNDVKLLWERSNPPKRVDFYIISKGVNGYILEKSGGNAEIYEDDNFLCSLNKYEWELFKPYVDNVEYVYLLRTSILNDFIFNNSEKIRKEYSDIIQLWNKKLFQHLSYFIKQISDADVKDTFYFKIAPNRWTQQFMCRVRYSEELGRLTYRILGQSY